MTALVSENTIDARPVRSRCECTENQTELYLSVDKLKKKKKEGTMLLLKLRILVLWSTGSAVQKLSVVPFRIIRTFQD